MGVSLLTLVATAFAIVGNAGIFIFKKPVFGAVLFTISNIFWVLASIFILQDIPSLVMWSFFLVSSTIGIFRWRGGSK